MSTLELHSQKSDSQSEGILRGKLSGFRFSKKHVKKNIKLFEEIVQKQWRFDEEEKPVE